MQNRKYSEKGLTQFEQDLSCSQFKSQFLHFGFASGKFCSNSVAGHCISSNVKLNGNVRVSR